MAAADSPATSTTIETSSFRLSPPAPTSSGSRQVSYAVFAFARLRGGFAVYETGARV
ncbi:MAG TPA: hypothetical protein VGB07_21035 [Blastocatellia bacterium]